MVFKNYYKILSLETNRVSSEQIKNAYRIAAKRNHPDVNVGDKLAEERLKDINEAYRVLSNPSSKRKYDRMWVSNVGRKNKKEYDEANRNSEGVFNEFFNMFFGNVDTNKENKSKKAPIKGENIETAIDVEIEEVFYGLDKKISLRTVDGKMKVFTVAIPAGIRNGEKIRLIGQGKEGENGGKNGDLFIKVNIQNNEKFKLKGNDIYTNLYLTPWEAALGTRTQIDSVDDSTQIYIPEGIQTGEVLKIQGKGYKDGKGGRGDLIAEVKIMVPKELSEKERELFETLKENSKFNPRENK